MSVQSLYPLVGLVVGLVVGLTGVGGGSLMTPALVAVIPAGKPVIVQMYAGIPPVAAIVVGIKEASA